MAVQGELPVWVSGQQLWVRGLDKKTTCNDVIKTLLGHSDDNYVIVERWRRVERPLGGDTRLLKLWTTWGDAQDEVKLSLKRISDDDSGRGSPVSYTSRRRKHHHHKSHHNRKQQANQQTNSLQTTSLSQTLHPKRLQQLSKTQNIERLLKLILLQGETIQSQLQRLHERDDQIEHLEDEAHKVRVNMLGSNYVLETYLGSSAKDDASNDENKRTNAEPSTTPPSGETEKENDSGIATETGPTSSSSENTSNTPTTEDTKDDENEEYTTIEEDIETEIQELQKRIDLWEKVLKVNKKLEKEEETLLRLYINVRKCDEIYQLKTELDKKSKQIDYNNKELDKCNYTLSETEMALNGRRKYLKHLQAELDASDLETEMLLQVQNDSTNLVSNTSNNSSKSSSSNGQMLKPMNDFDSNSDTGLSSLHSSSCEEGTYVLDTLV